jgi:hypothetical protein
LDITENGVVEESDKEGMQTIIKNLDDVGQVAQSLKLWLKKNL